MKTLFVCLLLLLIPILLLAKEPYQKYAKDRCEWCGKKGSLLNALNVHHIIPQHINPALKNEPSNLVTLCRRCHFTLGHKNNWTNSVPEIAILFNKKE